ncbi:MAG: SPOR domain-containing protein [Erythrobacter sp.]|nr:SPOR domain-containing protein [Erythrobacter sp.]
MRFPVSFTHEAFLHTAKWLLSGASVLALSACALGDIGGFGAASDPPEPVAARSIPSGPAADYPMVLGEPFTIDGITYTPADTLNYDEVGYATLDDSEAVGITASHRTLPLPSYVEVTSLDSGRTILVRVERRGPLTNTRLLGLSRAAATQLGIGEGAAVRVRRVNPPEEQRAELRADRSVDPRMETPQGLLEVLKRELPAVGSAPLGRTDTGNASASARGDIKTIDPTTGSEQAPTNTRPQARPTPAPTPVPTPRQTTPAATATPTPAATPAAPAPATRGNLAVQAGAYSTRAAAQRVADAIGGYVEPTGSLFRVRVGPFANRGEASTALAKVRSSGYRDALIVDIR